MGEFTLLVFKVYFGSVVANTVWSWQEDEPMNQCQDRESEGRSRHTLLSDCQQRYQSNLMERMIFSKNEIIRTEQPHAKGINPYLIPHTRVNTDAPLT